MLKTAVFTGLFLLGTGAFAADPQLLNLVMTDAKVMAGVNVTAAKISPLGQFVLTHMAQNGGNGFDSLTAQTGFDPRQDVTEILAASSGAQQQGVVLARGSFNVDKISAAAAKDAHSKVEQYGGATLIVDSGAKLSHAVAFIGNSIAVAGDVASVKAAVDRNAGVNSISPALGTRVQQLSTTYDAWSVSLASLSALLPQLGGTNLKGPGSEMLNIVKDVQESSGGVKFGANVEITAQAVTSDPKNATALGDLIKLFAGLASMAGGKDPNAAAAAQILQQLQVTTAGTAVNLALSLPETQVEALLKPAVQTHAQVR